MWKKTTIALASSAFIALLLAVIGLSGCVTINPSASAPASPPLPVPAIPTPTVTLRVTPIAGPPQVPQAVLLMWKSEPASRAYPPDVEDKITLKPNTASGSTQVSENMSLSVIPAGTWQDSTLFHLEEGQWVDVIVSSLDIPVYFLTEKVGAVSLKSECWAEYEGRKVRSTFGTDMGVFSPFYGKALYENRITSTEKGTIFTTAARVFAWNGATDYWFVLYNFNREKKADITCHVYKLGSTPGWGKDFEKGKLQPWLNDLYYMLVGGKISQEEYNQAEARWLEQFR